MLYNQVIPANAGIQLKTSWSELDPRLRGDDRKFMLSKDKRLNLKKDFKWVAAGKKIETKYLKLFIKLGNNGTPRIGIALSSKNFQKATDRNKARRITSAAFESLYGSLLPECINIVALPKQGVIEVKSGDVLLDLEEELEKEGILRDKDIKI